MYRQFVNLANVVLSTNPKERCAKIALKEAVLYLKIRRNLSLSIKLLIKLQ